MHLSIDSLTYHDILQKAIEIKPENRDVYVDKHLSETQPLDSLSWLSEWELFNLFEENAIHFYSLDNQYTTPLQLKSFQATDEYQGLVDSMKEYKLKSKEHIFRIELGLFSKEKQTPEYDLQKHGFVFTLKDWNDLWDKPIQIRAFEGLHLSLFDISRLKPIRENPGKSGEAAYLVIPVPESKALEIEKLNYQCEVWILFDFKNYSKVPYQYTDKSGKQQNSLYSRIIPNHIRIVFADTSQENIIYSITYNHKHE